MDVLVGALISGIVTGMIYAMIALGFVLIYKSSGVLNIAQGELLLFGACIGWTLFAYLQLSVWLALLLTILASALLGMLVERLALRPLIGESILSMIMVTIALALFLRGFIGAIWPQSPYAYPPIFQVEPFRIGGYTVTIQSVFAFAISLILIIVFVIYFKYTRTGLGMRATADDQQAARGVGVKVGSVFRAAWAIAAMVAAVGGFFLGSMIGVDMELSHLGLVVLPVVLLGGLESIPGVIVGGVIMGLAENLAGIYLDPLLPHAGGLRGVFPFIIMLLVLFIRPYGIFGLKRIERV